MAEAEGKSSGGSKTHTTSRSPADQWVQNLHTPGSVGGKRTICPSILLNQTNSHSFEGTATSISSFSIAPPWSRQVLHPIPSMNTFVPNGISGPQATVSPYMTGEPEPVTVQSP